MPAWQQVWCAESTLKASAEINQGHDQLAATLAVNDSGDSQRPIAAHRL